MTRASAVSKRVLKASTRNALTVTQRACLLIEHGNQLKAEKQHRVMVDGENGADRRKEEKLDGEHFISDDTCVLMAFAELQSATMTNKENRSSCQPALKGLCEKTLEAPFSQECLLNKIMRVNTKQMLWVFLALLQFLMSTTCEGMLL